MLQRYVLHLALRHYQFSRVLVPISHQAVYEFQLLHIITNIWYFLSHSVYIYWNRNLALLWWPWWLMMWRTFSCLLDLWISFFFFWLKNFYYFYVQWMSFLKYPFKKLGCPAFSLIYRNSLKSYICLVLVICITSPFHVVRLAFSLYYL